MLELKIAVIASLGSSIVFCFTKDVDNVYFIIGFLFLGLICDSMENFIND